MSESPSPLFRAALIFVGAGSGGLLRFWLGRWIQGLTSSSFPLGTLTINVSGCFAVGVLASLFSGPAPIREEFRAGVLVGVLGGYTTFSAFGRETMALVADGKLSAAVLNVVLSNALGLAGVWAGHLVARAGGMNAA